MRRTVMLWFALLTACGGREPSEKGPVPTPSEQPTEDDLLARARASISGGRVSPDSVDRIMASRDARYSRARRLLAVLQDDAAPAPPAADVVPVRPPGDETAPPEPVAETSPPSLVAPEPGEALVEATRDDAEPSASETELRPPARARITGVSLARGKGGVTLTVKGSEPFQVGVARSADGLVRLVVPAGATAGALKQRPQVAGVAVTDVQGSGATVLLKVRLEAGWEVGRVRAFAGGARITFEGPAD